MDGDDVHNPTTAFQDCALATDTPPNGCHDLVERDTQPLGHLSSKQSKNQQEQVEQVLNY
jgi:hypothetical protein